MKTKLGVIATEAARGLDRYSEGESVSDNDLVTGIIFLREMIAALGPLGDEYALTRRHFVQRLSDFERAADYRQLDAKLEAESAFWLDQPLTSAH